MNVHPSIAPLLEKGLPHIGEEDITWAMTIGFLALDVIKKGFRLGAVFVLFPVYIFILMEIAGYIVLFTTGTRHEKREANERRKAQYTPVVGQTIAGSEVKLPSQPVPVTSKVTITRPARTSVSGLQAAPAIDTDALRERIVPRTDEMHSPPI